MLNEPWMKKKFCQGNHTTKLKFYYEITKVLCSNNDATFYILFKNNKLSLKKNAVVLLRRHTWI